MDTTQKSQWRRIMELTASMLAATDKDDWPAVMQFEQDRRALIEGFFATPLNDTDSSLIKEDIEGILETDAHVLSLSKEMRGNIYSQLELIRKSKRASKAYSGS